MVSVLLGAWSNLIFFVFKICLPNVLPNAAIVDISLLLTCGIVHCHVASSTVTWHSSLSRGIVPCHVA